MKVKLRTVQEKPVTSHPDYVKVVEHFKVRSATTRAYQKHIESYPNVVVEALEETSIHHLNIKFKMMFIQVYIDGSPYKFLLDTGAQMSCLSYKLKDHILGQGIIEVGDASGVKENMTLGYTKEIDCLGLKIKNLPVLLLNEGQLSLNVLNRTVFSLDGIIGYDVLKHMDFELDYKNQLFVRQSHKMTEQNLIDTDFPVVMVNTHDHLLYFGVDTGAKKSWISKELIEKLNLKVIKEKKKKVYGAHGRHEECVSVVSHLNLQLGQEEISFKGIETGFTCLVDDICLHGVLGLDVLKKHKLQVSHSYLSMDLVKPPHKFS